MTQLQEKIKESALFLESHKTGNAKIAIVLGSGLNALVDMLVVNKEIACRDIPHFPVATVKGHKGSWIFGTLNGIDIVALNGRFHYYEGYTMQEVTFPIRVMKAIGIEKIILTNAAGGMNPTFQIGDIMLVKDHINMFADNPLLGTNDDRLGVRFPDMSDAYSPNMIRLAKQIAQKEEIHLQQGVYVGVSGPCFETPAEYRMFSMLGGDAVGMSTVPETIVARHADMEVFAISVITDLGIIGQVEKVSHTAVLQAANQAGHTIARLIYAMLPQL